MNSAHFSFKLRKDRPKSDGSCSIYLYANINGKLKWYTTNRSVKEKFWSDTKQEAIGLVPNKFEINNQLTTYIQKAKKYIQQCDIDDQIARTDKLDKILRTKIVVSNNYCDFVENYIKEFKSKYSYGSIQVFTTHLNKVKKFRENIDVNAIDRSFWYRFEAYLKDDGNNINTIHKQYRQFRKFLNMAVEFDIIKENPLKEMKVKRAEGNREYLTIDELKELQKVYDNAELNIPGHQNVLKYFLFACYTSLRYQDVFLLKHNNIKNDSLIIKTQKTGKPLKIPLSKKATALIDSEALPNNKVFNVYTNQVTNRHLKAIIKHAEINKKISFHCARNTWAMITLELTYNIALVSDILGHSDIRITQIYAKIQEKAKKEAMAKWDSI